MEHVVQCKNWTLDLKVLNTWEKLNTVNTFFKINLITWYQILYLSVLLVSIKSSQKLDYILDMKQLYLTIQCVVKTLNPQTTNTNDKIINDVLNRMS